MRHVKILCHVAICHICVADDCFSVAIAVVQCAHIQSVATQQKTDTIKVIIMEEKHTQYSHTLTYAHTLVLYTYIRSQTNHKLHHNLNKFVYLCWRLYSLLKFIGISLAKDTGWVFSFWIFLIKLNAMKKALKRRKNEWPKEVVKIAFISKITNCNFVSLSLLSLSLLV